MTLTVDERVKTLHAIAPDFTEQKSLKEIAALFGCSPSAFDGGAYYENTLKTERAKVRASKALKRAKGLEPFQAEDDRANREMREHGNVYEDIDAKIDATWSTRKGGHFGTR